VKKVIVALSGGPKSFVTAWLLKKQGMQVRGLYLDITDNQSLSEKMGEYERKLGIPIQIISAKAIADTVLRSEHEHAFSSGAQFNLKQFFIKRILLPKLLEVRESLQFDHVSTGQAILLQEDTVSKMNRVMRSDRGEQERASDLLGLRPRDLSYFLLPMGSIPESMIEKLERELMPDEAAHLFDIDWDQRLAEDGVFTPDQVFQVFAHTGMLVGQTRLGQLALGSEYSSENKRELVYRIYDIRPDLQRIQVKLDIEFRVDAIELNEASWFTLGDLGFKTLTTSMIWGKRKRAVPVRVIQFEGKTLKAVMIEPLLGLDAHLFKGDSVLWVEGNEILGGAVVTGLA